jgi:deoxyribodipyrimidine photo-lyase
MSQQQGQEPSPQPIDPSRVKHLTRPTQDGAAARSVVYWMSRSVRADANHALAYARARADAAGLPLVVLFALCDGYPGANARHYAFLLHGVADAQQTLAIRQIPLVVLRVSGEGSAAALPHAVAHAARAAGARVLVVDRGYTRNCRAWRAGVAAAATGCEVVQIESDAVVPVDLASTRAEPAAATLRVKMSRHMERFLREQPPPVPRAQTAELADEAAARAREIVAAAPQLARVSAFESPLDAAAALALLDVDRSVPPVSGARGGATCARRALALFVRDRLHGYAGRRNEPGLHATSGLSAFLHYGHLSPLTVARACGGVPGGARPARASARDVSKFLDELIVRREHALNFASRVDGYDNYAGAVPRWARETLELHSAADAALAGDGAGAAERRRVVCAALERGESACELWNLAQWQLVSSGFMHNYMRMYWAKSLLRWLPPADAHALAVALNDKYELDGRDPNGYIGIAWCFGFSDRPFPSRPPFGAVRAMSASAIRAKKDVQAYRALVLRGCASALALEPRLEALLPACAFAGGQHGLGHFLRAAAPKLSSAAAATPTEARPAGAAPASNDVDACGVEPLGRAQAEPTAPSDGRAQLGGSPRPWPPPPATQPQLQRTPGSATSGGRAAAAAVRHSHDIRAFFGGGGAPGTSGTKRARPEE